MHPRETVDRALLLSAQGLLDPQVAALCGVSTTTVRRWRTGTRRSGSDLRSRSCPRCHDRELELEPYAQLLGLYLGDGHVVRCRKEVYQLSLHCDDRWPGLIEEALDVMSRVMPTSR